MRKRSRAPVEGGDTEDWLVTYADAITLLMAFFVMLFTLATAQGGELAEATDALAEQFSGKGAAGPGAATAPAADATEAALTDLRSIIQTQGLGDAVTVEQHDRGLAVTFSGDVLFAPGAVELQPAALGRIAPLLQQVVTQAQAGHTVEVEGHTDDTPMAGSQGLSNWDLSALRAARLAAVLEARGLPGKRINVVGYGATLPLAQNRDEAEQAIPANKARNRRVSLVLKRP